MRFLLILWLSLLTAQASTWTVKTSGGDFATLTLAFASGSVVNGDTIDVYTGLYTETPSTSKQLTIRAAAGNTPLIQGGIQGVGASSSVVGLSFSNITGSNIAFIDVANRDNLVFAFNKFTNSAGTGSSSAIKTRNCRNVLIATNEMGVSNKGININSGSSLDGTYANGTRIIGNHIQNCPIDGIDIQGQYFTISDNVIYDCIDVNWAANHPDGIQFIRSTIDGFVNVQHARVYGNKIRNYTQGIFTEGMGASVTYAEDIWIYNNVLWCENATINGVDMTSITTTGIIIKGSKDVVAFNNTIGGHTGFRLRVQSDGTTGTGMVVKNNVFYSDSIPLGSGVSIEDTGSIASGDLNYNRYYSFATRAVTWGVGNYTLLSSFQAAVPTQEINGTEGDPLVNAMPTPTAVSALSPIVDTGTSESAYFTTDILGVTRPQRLAWDIGAYELPGTPGFLFLGGQVFNTVNQ